MHWSFHSWLPCWRHLGWKAVNGCLFGLAVSLLLLVRGLAVLLQLRGDIWLHLCLPLIFLIRDIAQGFVVDVEVFNDVNSHLGDFLGEHSVLVCFRSLQTLHQGAVTLEVLEGEEALVEQHLLKRLLLLRKGRVCQKG